MRRKLLFRQWVTEHPDRLYQAEREPADFRKWLDQMRKDRPLVLEFGMGTGGFLNAKAAQDPETFFLGVEVKPDRIFRAFERAEQEGIENIAFLQTKVERMPEYQLPQADIIYLLFSDPWPKDRHARRRMTAEGFLELYRSLLSPEGVVIQKTDDPELFEYSVACFEQQGWKLFQQEAYTTPEAEQTAYERKFLKQGKPIFYLEARP